MQGQKYNAMPFGQDRNPTGENSPYPAKARWFILKGPPVNGPTGQLVPRSAPGGRSCSFKLVFVKAVAYIRVLIGIEPTDALLPRGARSTTYMAWIWYVTLGLVVGYFVRSLRARHEGEKALKGTRASLEEYTLRLNKRDLLYEAIRELTDELLLEKKATSEKEARLREKLSALQHQYEQTRSLPSPSGWDEPSG